MIGQEKSFHHIEIRICSILVDICLSSILNTFL